MKWAYFFFIRLYPLMAKLLAPFNSKAALWVKGRKGLMPRIKTAMQLNDQPIIWMHAASLGEFEQGLPMLESINKQYPQHRLLVTFFSPSGYEVRKNHPLANWVFYLPMDSPINAAEFIAVVKPSIALFIKYEFWYFYLTELKKHQIPTLLVSGIFRREQLFFKWYGGFYRKMLLKFTHFFVQDEGSADLIKDLVQPNSITISGDTRFDRVLTIAAARKQFPIIEQFCANRPIIIAGSTWSDDDKVLQHFTKVHRIAKFIIAPHQISRERLAECMQRYPSPILLSEFESSTNNQLNNFQTLIIDNVGMLSSLYYYATIAFIGGGFTNEGIHNTLEAAVFGKPVVFGPVYDKYLEAVDMVEIGAAFSADTALEMEVLLDELLRDDDKRILSGKAGAEYVTSNAGASGKILDYIQANRLLTS
jgi:3-deoxy-D-manno-octulosonic-acid transferase